MGNTIRHINKILFLISVLAFSMPLLVQAQHNHSACDDDSISPMKEAILSEVTVTGLTGTQRMKDSPIAFSVISPKSLNLGMGSNIVDVIARQPGISQITTGAGISKPVIRGLGYNRVVVVDQGIRQEGQQWGDEHGLEVDAEGVHSVEILKGPASLMYGSDAIAGVMILHPEHALELNTMQAKVGGEYQSNNSLWNWHAGFAGNIDGWLWNWHYNDKSAQCYRNARDGKVDGSWFDEKDVQGVFGVNKHWGHSWLRFSHVNFKPGIIGEEGSFQKVLHTKVVSDNAFYIGHGTLNAIVGYQQNFRREFEDGLDEASLAMRLHTVNYDVRYSLPLPSDWNISGGVNGMWQKNLNEAEGTLIPEYNLFDFGVFATADKVICDRWHLSGGVRVDNRKLIDKNFTGLTGSIGVVYNVNDRMNLRLNVARGFRAPTVSELYSDGVHEGSVQYELGNKNLKSEFSTQVDLGMDYTMHYMAITASLFTNFISNYIFLGRLPYETEGYRTYQYRQGDARLMGGEVSVDLHPVNSLHVDNTFSYVRGVLLHQPAESHNLPMMPAPKWTCDVRYEFPDFANNKCRRAFVSAGMDYNLRQGNYYALDDTETATPAYALFNLSAGMDLHILGHNCIELSLSCQNLFDKVYQNHLSRLKYLEGGGISGMGRNFCVKVNIPIDIHL